MRIKGTMGVATTALFLLMLLAPVHALEQAFWYDESREVRLWEAGYNSEHQSPAYSESSHPKARKQVLTGRIIIVFLEDKASQALEQFMRQNHLSFIQKISIGTRAYLFQAEGDKANSLKIANKIYKTVLVQASYPDWLYLDH